MSKQNIAKNKKAWHNYEILETLEVGIVLSGTEVKSLRAHHIKIEEAFVDIQEGQLWVRQLYIAPYMQGSFYNHEPTRKRKLLAHRKQIRELSKAVEQKGQTIVVLEIYFKDGIAKVLIGVARGKKNVDKRHSIKERDEKRRMDRLKKMIK